MSGSTNETEDGEGVFSMDSTDSPLIDEGNSGGGGAHVLKKGPWTPAEDAVLVDYVKKHGEGNWNAVQRQSGLFRCGKSCRLRWANHLRPNLKKGAFTPEEEHMIIELHSKFGNKWARMASHLSGRTDNEIKNYWNTRMKRRQRAGLPIYPATTVQHHQGGGRENENNMMNNCCKEIQSNSSSNNNKKKISNNDGFNGIDGNHSSIFPEITAEILTKSFSVPSYLGLNGMPMYSERGGRCLSMVEQAKDVERRYALSYPYSGNERLFNFVGAEGRCSLPNCTISSSASSSSSSSRLPPCYSNGGCLNSELPSFQYQQQQQQQQQQRQAFDEYGLCPSSSSYLPHLPDPGLNPPPPSSFLQPGIQNGGGGGCCGVISSVNNNINSGLLDALLHESYNLGSSHKASSSSGKSSVDTTNPPPPTAAADAADAAADAAVVQANEWNVWAEREREEGYWDMFSEMDESVASILHESDANISIDGLMEEKLPHHYHHHHPSPNPPILPSGCEREEEEEEEEREVEESEWGGVEEEEEQYGGGKENVMTDEVLSCFLGRKIEGNGLGESYRVGSELSSSLLWNNMPSIFQFSDHHAHF